MPISKTSKDISVEPPVGGWNTRDSIDNIPPTDAIVIDNWTCGLGSVSVRKGSLNHAYSYGMDTHVAGQVKTLMKYDSGDVQKMFAADNGVIWDATSPGQGVDWWQYVTTPGDPPDGPFSSDVFSWTNFRGGLGNDSYGYLVAVNGVEAVAYYDHPTEGFGFYKLVFTGDGESLSPVGCFAFKNRMYYWESNSQSVWYTDLYAVAGALTEVQFGGVGQFGGAVIAVESVTHDGGAGTDDYLLIYMSGGEVLAYQGSYPDDEADWALVGIYNPGLPMSPRGFAKFGGDLMMMTDLDILPMSKLLKGVEAAADLTKISGAMQRVAPLRGNFGFQVEIFPPSKLMVFNIPQGTEFHQFVMNTVTGAWSRWTGIQSYCWLEFDGNLYYGTDDGNVFKAEEGNFDAEFAPSDIGLTNYRYSDIAPVSYGLAGDAYLSPVDLYEEAINVNFIDDDGVDRTSDLVLLQVGDTLTMRNEASTAVRTITIELITYTNQYVSFYGSRDVKTGSFITGSQILVDTSGASGAVVSYGGRAILSDVQTAWLRFGVEENKQWDAVKLFLLSNAPVYKAIRTETDYKQIPAFNYPKESTGSSLPWSGEWDPDAGPVATIPDPTTWWTDEPARPEGPNPPTPVNDVTGVGGDGAVTEWGVETRTQEQWDIVSGNGRAISLALKLATKIPVAWTLTFWHTKIASRM